MTDTLPQNQPASPGGFGIDHRLGAAALRAPAASREDSCPQAILKFHHPSSLDYRAHHFASNIEGSSKYMFVSVFSLLNSTTNLR